jgi:hypothetical protein
VQAAGALQTAAVVAVQASEKEDPAAAENASVHSTAAEVEQTVSAPQKEEAAATPEPTA